jgi:hypothetical protein
MTFFSLYSTPRGFLIENPGIRSEDLKTLLVVDITASMNDRNMVNPLPYRIVERMNDVPGVMCAVFGDSAHMLMPREGIEEGLKRIIPRYRGRDDGIHMATNFNSIVKLIAPDVGYVYILTDGNSTVPLKAPTSPNCVKKVEFLLYDDVGNQATHPVSCTTLQKTINPKAPCSFKLIERQGGPQFYKPGELDVIAAEMIDATRQHRLVVTTPGIVGDGAIMGTPSKITNLTVRLNGKDKNFSVRFRGEAYREMMNAFANSALDKSPSEIIDTLSLLDPSYEWMRNLGVHCTTVGDNLGAVMAAQTRSICIEAFAKTHKAM